MTAPLAGVQAVELGGAPCVGYAGKLFRDLGADVTRVGRALTPQRSALEEYLGARKERLALDLSSVAGRARLDALLANAHVLFCGTTDRSLEVPVDAKAIAAAHPKLVVASMSPFGLTGAAQHWPADDLTLQARGGISIGIGLPQKPPLKLPGDQSAFQAGLSAALAAAGALLSGRGALIDVAAADVWAAFYCGVEVALSHFGRHRKVRAGHRVSGQPYPRTIYRCRDGYFAIQCGETRHWQSFLSMIGRPDLLAHPLFANRFKANDEHGDACDALIEPWLLARTKNEILNACIEHRIPGAPVYDVREVLEHPHLRARGYFREVDTARGRVPLPGDPYGALTREPVRTEAGTLKPAPGPVPQARVAHDNRRPLAGLRVLDFGWVWAGAVPGHVLADLGAEVIKVESAKPLDYMRQGRPIVGSEKDPEQNPMFQNVNRGKLSLRIKLDHPDAKAVLLDLVAASDVVIENFSPGVMRKFGLSYAELKRVRPDLVMCSMSAVGQEGPLASIRTYATMIASLAGMDSQVAYPAGRVLGSQSSYADPNASLHAALGIVAALMRRARTGEGAYIDLSQWEAAVNVMGGQVAQYAIDGVLPQPGDAFDGVDAPHGHYPAQGGDRWIAISVKGDVEWQALLACLGRPEALLTAAYAASAGRRAHRDQLDRLLALETRRQDAAALARALCDAGIAAAPLLDAQGIAADMHFRERGLFETVEHPVLGALPVYRLPWHIDGAPLPITRRAPLLGEHNAYALRTVLGYSQARVEALTESGLFA